MALILTASDPLYPEWDDLLTQYAQALNPQCHFDLCQEAETAEYKAGVKMLKDEIVEYFEELVR